MWTRPTMRLRRACTILSFSLCAVCVVGGSRLQMIDEKSAQAAGGRPPPVLTPQSSCEDVASWVSPDIRSPVLLQVVSAPYLKLQHNFFLVMQRNTEFPMTNVYLACLDKESVRYLDDKFSFHCVETDKVPRYPGVWIFRTLLLTCLVKEGLDVIMSDNDALWLRDPRPELASIKGDIVVQRGSMPQEFAEPVHGTTICMGFALFRAGGAGMTTFLNFLLEETIRYKNDQWGVNSAASRLNIRWDHNERTTSDMRKFASTDFGYGFLTDLPDEFMVTYLPNSRYSRNCHEVQMSEDGVVAHCFPHPHKPQIKKLGLWYLD